MLRAPASPHLPDVLRRRLRDAERQPRPDRDRGGELRKRHEELQHVEARNPRHERRQHERQLRAPAPGEEQSRHQVEGEEQEGEDLAVRGDGVDHLDRAEAEGDAGPDDHRDDAGSRGIVPRDRHRRPERRECQAGERDRRPRETAFDREHDEPDHQGARPAEREGRQTARDQLATLAGEDAGFVVHGSLRLSRATDLSPEDRRGGRVAW